MGYLVCPALAILGAISWMPVVGSRVGYRLAVPVVAVGTAWLELLAQVVGGAIHGDVGVTAVIVGAAAFVAGTAATILGRSTVAPRSRDVAYWLPPLLGGACWLVVVLVASTSPGSASRAWAMNGDGQNFLHQSADVLRDGGLRPYGDPVPLVPTTLAAIIAPSRPTSYAATLDHDITGLVVYWALGLVFTCLALGAVAASLIPRSRRMLVGVVGALASLGGTSWLVLGMPIHWGWMNTAVAIPLALCVWLIHLPASRSPILALTALLLLATLLLATWAPLVLLAAASALVLLLRHQTRIRTAPLRWRIVLGAAGLQLVVWCAVSTVPAFVGSSGAALLASGEAFPSLLPALVVLLLAVAGAAVLAWRRRAARLAVLLVAAGAGTALGEVLVLVITRADDPFSAYYPLKYAWLATVVLSSVLVAVGVGALSRGAVARRRRRGLAPAAVGVVVVALLAATFLPPLPVGARDTRLPAATVADGRVWRASDVTVSRILSFASRPSQVILWRSGLPDEQIIDFWLVVSARDWRSRNRDRAVAFAYTRWWAYRERGADVHSEALLCGAIAESRHPVSVVTRGGTATRRLITSCGGVPTSP